MLAIEGYYDGVNIRPLGQVLAQPNQRLVITIMDEFIEPAGTVERSGVRGMLAEYADHELAGRDRGAWERAMLKKHGAV